MMGGWSVSEGERCLLRVDESSVVTVNGCTCIIDEVCSLEPPSCSLRLLNRTPEGLDLTETPQPVTTWK